MSPYYTTLAKAYNSAAWNTVHCSRHFPITISWNSFWKRKMHRPLHSYGTVCVWAVRHDREKSWHGQVPVSLQATWGTGAGQGHQDCLSPIPAQLLVGGLWALHLVASQLLSLHSPHSWWAGLPLKSLLTQFLPVKGCTHSCLMPEKDSRGFLTLFRGNGTEGWMSLQTLGGQPKRRTLAQGFMHLRRAVRWMSQQLRFSTAGVAANWKKHSGVLLITNGQGKTLPPVA